MLLICLSQVRMWNDIEILVNDDTGREQLSACIGHECGSALYQVDALLQITSSEKVEFIKAAFSYFLITMTTSLTCFAKCCSYM